ncbi:MAG: site-specific integrase [Chloroflexi bacterium]|nr:site-specific integrase [Chloroflexota bacterium]
MGKRKGSISHRKDGRYMGRYTAILPNGIKTVQAVYGKTRAEADKKLRDIIVEADRGKTVSRDGQTLEEFVEYWLENIAPLKIKVTTISRYKDTLRLHILPSLGQKRLLSIEPMLVQRLIIEKYKKTKSAKCCVNIKNTLSSVLKSALQLQLIYYNLAVGVSLPKYTVKEKKIWTKEQLNTFLQEAEKSSTYYPIYKLMSYGLRRGEALGVRRQDIDFNEGTLLLEQQVVALDGKPYICGLKTAGSRRTLPLSKDVLDILKNVKIVSNNDDLIFTTSHGTPILPRNLYRDFERVVKVVALPHISLHALRHMAATFLKDAKVDPKTVQSILGHASITTTLQFYQHSNLDNKREAFTAYDTLIGQF